MNNQLMNELLEQNPEIQQTYLLYQKSVDIYKRTQLARGIVPGIRVHIASTKSIKVNNGTNWSSKVFTCK